MGVDGKFPCRNRIRQEYYNIGSINGKIYEYQHDGIHIQTAYQGKIMRRDEQNMNISDIIMTHYSLKQGMQRSGKSLSNLPLKN